MWRLCRETFNNRLKARGIMRKKVCLIIVIVIMSVCALGALTACSHINNINSSLDKIQKGNYTLEVHSELSQGAVDSVRKYDGEKIYLNYSEQELYFDNISERYIDRYLKRDNKWVVDRVRSDDISFDITENFAYAALKLALTDRDTKFNSDKKGYYLKEDAFAEVFGTVNGNSAKIVRQDGATVIIAEYNNGKTDTIRIINIGKTKIKLPSVE